jgi:hypothetical protein
MHFPHDNQGQMQPKCATAAHSFIWAQKSESQRKQTEIHFNFSKKVKSEGSAPGFEAPILFESIVKQGSTRYMWWTSAEPKLAVSVTSVTNKVNPFFRADRPYFRLNETPQNVRNSITCFNAGLYLGPFCVPCYLRVR